MGKNTLTTKPVKGMRDFFPEEMRIRTWLFEAWRKTAQRFGYEEYDACVLESEELFTRKAGDEIVEQLYNFEDKGGRRLAARPEVTPSLTRMLMARGQAQVYPARWFTIAQCFRYERMQKGRKREHFQWNMDLVGLQSVAAEVELMSAQAAFLQDVGFRIHGDSPQITFRVSNRRILENFLNKLEITGDAFQKACVLIDKTDKIGDDKTLELLGENGIAPKSGQAILDLIKVKGLETLRQHVGPDDPGYQELETLMKYADAAGLADLIEIDLGVVRGLSYYTGTVWELFETTGSIPRAIAGGGRYDKLMETMGGPALPMVGFGFGDVVIELLLAEHKLLPEPTARIDDVVYPMQETGFVVANQIARRLREEKRRV